MKITITKRGINLDRLSNEALNFPKTVNIGIDINKKVLGIQEAKDNKNIKEYKLYSMNRGTASIMSSKLSKIISDIYQATVPFRLEVDYDNEQKMLIADLNIGKRGGR